MYISITTILFPTFLSIFLYLFFSTSNHKSQIHKGFKHYPLVGALPLFLLNRHRFLDWTTEVLRHCRSNTAAIRRPGEATGVMTANPLVVEHILKTRFENYPKGERLTSIFGDFLGRGIFNSDGEIWRAQRKTASYEFKGKSLRGFVAENVADEIRMRLVPVLNRACETGDVLDLQDVLERFAFDNVCKLSFGFDPACLGRHGGAAVEFMRAFESAATLTAGRYAIPKWYKVERFFNMGSEKTLKKSISTVHKFADDIICSRIMQENKKIQNNNQDLLSRFMKDKHNNSPKLLRDIIISFILAGRDTTSSALTWFFWILSSRLDIHQKILTELQIIRSKTGKQIGETYNIDELRDMQYLQAALLETLRLYPPVPIDSKECRNDDVLPDGTIIGKGWFVVYNAYAMGRLESIWGKNCGEFLPDRWLENGVCLPESPFRFPVFHAGPRMCPGKEMAFIQMKAIVAAVVEMFELGVVEKMKTPKHLLSLTLRMENGLQVRVKKRHMEECQVVDSLNVSFAPNNNNTFPP